MSDNKRTGLGLCDVLLVVFVVLKLIGVTNWGWGWVLAPLWIPILRMDCRLKDRAGISQPFSLP